MEFASAAALPPSPAPPEPHEPPDREGRPKRVSESRRIQEVYEHLPPSLRGSDLSGAFETDPHAPFPPPSHQPQLCADAALNAFAQLAAVRLKASTALISLIDAKHQYILAEARADLRLRCHDMTGASSSSLWLGNACIPRRNAICEEVLLQQAALSQHRAFPAPLIINDLQADEKYAKRSHVPGRPRWCFYAGVPLLSARRAIIGTLSILDPSPRAGLSSDEVLFMEDLAPTIVEYLATHKLREEHQKAKRMLHELINFVEGSSPDHNSMPESARLSKVSNWTGRSQSKLPLSSELDLKGSTRSTTAGDIVHSTDPPVEIGLEQEATASEAALDTPRSGPVRDATVSSMAEERDSETDGSIAVARRTNPRLSQTRHKSSLPIELRLLYARAAETIRETCKFDAVAIFDTSVVAIGVKRQSTSPHHSMDEHSDEEEPITPFADSLSNQWRSVLPSDPSVSVHDAGGVQHKHARPCPMIGFSTSQRINPESIPLTADNLRVLLNQYTEGGIINFGADGGAMITDDSEPSTISDANSTENFSGTTPDRIRGSKRRKNAASVMQTVVPGARSVVFLPLWDYERARWVASIFCWTTRTEHSLFNTLDLLYLRAFGNNITAETSRREELLSARMKTSFIASISHELRSPLHGILGGSEFLQQTSLDTLQTTMLLSIKTCGRTLLDTIDHVLEYVRAERVTNRTKSHTEIKDPTTIVFASKPLKQLALLESTEPIIDFSAKTEEVVEAVFAGQSFQTLQYGGGNDNSAAGFMIAKTAQLADTSTSGTGKTRNLTLVVLDIAYLPNWKLRFPLGAWQRLVINVVGNALKFTESGFVKVSLRMSHRKGKWNGRTAGVVLTVSDTGVGMTSEFLKNNLYSPFTQENSFTAGLGLGLNMVRQIAHASGGRIEINSEPQRGTKVVVKFLLPLAPDSAVEAEREEFSDAINRHIRGKRVCVLDRPSTSPELSSIPSAGRSEFVNALITTLKDWLGMEVITSHEWHGHQCDLVICPEPSFEYLAAVRARRDANGKAPASIFLAVDALEADALRNDARVLNKESVVEIITQPCGPTKLAKALEICFTRFEAIGENIASPVGSLKSAITTPAVEISDPFAAKAPERLIPAFIHSLLGTTPADPSESSLPEEPTSFVDAPPEMSLKVLIVDDNYINRRLLLAHMNKIGYVSEEASNGLEAVKLYQAASPPFDVVLMDLSMPVMDGMTATRNIRKFEQQMHRPRVLVVALTGLVSEASRLEARQSGIDKYLVKPVNFKELLLFLESVMKRPGDAVEGDKTERVTVSEVTVNDVQANGELDYWGEPVD